MQSGSSPRGRARHEGRVYVARIAARMLQSVLFVLLAGMQGVTVHADDRLLAPPAGEVLLTVSGKIRNTNLAEVAALDESALRMLPRHVIETTTTVTDGVKRFEGFLMRDLLEMVGAQGRVVRASALNDYVIDIPMEDFQRFDVLVATHMDGVRLLSRDKGPFWIVYPRDAHEELQDIRYDYRWVWQLIRLEVK